MWCSSRTSWHSICARASAKGEPGRSWDRDLPVIVLGGQQADAVDRVRAFARGCDDFVVRPFHYDELVARIRAVLRRAQPAPGRVLGLAQSRSTPQRDG